MAMGHSQWNVLVVDDDPDVLSVSKLALRSFDVMGLPLNILTAASKAEAIALLESEEKWVSDIAVAFVDVVMESDTAGLELCSHIRNEMRNGTTQLFIRTGQPGIAPERSVIDDYDISGYFTKAEATEDKLYSLVKAGVRQFESLRNLQGAMGMLEGILEASHSKQAMTAVFTEMLNGFLPDGEGYKIYFTVDDEAVIGPWGMDVETAVKMKDRLMQSEGTPLRPDGDKMVRDGNERLVTVTGGPARSPAYAVVNFGDYDPQDPVLVAIHAFLRNLAVFWPRAGE